MPKSSADPIHSHPKEGLADSPSGRLWALFQHALVRQCVKWALDLVMAFLAWEISARLNGTVHLLPLGGVFWGLSAALLNSAFRLPRQHYRHIGFRDMLWVLMAGAALLVVASGLSAIPGLAAVGVDTWFLAAMLTASLWMLARGLTRAVHEFTPHRWGLDAQRTLVIGAGRAGVLVAEELNRHPELGGMVIGFIDDDLSKQGLTVHGVPVLGTQELLPMVVRNQQVEQIVLAIPSASGRDMRRLAERTQALGIQVKTVPGIFNLLGSQDWKPRLQDVSIEDLLRREPVQLDQNALAAALEDQIILITGAGGSIGSEIARQVCRFRPSRLVLLGRGENSLWAIERELRENFPNQPLALELCDVRNERRLEDAFAHWKPQVVFHAAAHKHVPFLELHPEEAVENNVFGTKNVLEACIKNRVPHFVNISTDKAVNPTNVLGVSKRMAECLVIEAHDRIPERGQYVSVRFGNVLGSRGSVVPIFRQQIQKGGPLTVTHPDMTRYFMTIPEASQLVIQTGILGESGRVYVLDMGDPVKIVDLAQDMIRLSGLTPGEDIEVAFSGIRPGEKLYEELFYDDNATASPVHPKVYEAQAECRTNLPVGETLARLKKAMTLKTNDRMKLLVQIFMEAVPTYKPAGNGMGKWL